jgi:CRP/FNR family transcriptional regulator, anaerobic regulatory protein
MDTSIQTGLADLKALKQACANCSLHTLCLPRGLSPEEIDRLDDMISIRRSLRKGENLYRAGETCQSLYAVRSGFLKTTLLNPSGEEHVTGFYMSGEVVGLDGIGAERFHCYAVALERSEICVVPLHALEDVSREIPTLHRHMMEILGREIARDHDMMLTLSELRAEQRVAAFLLNLSERLHTRGYSPYEFVLRMTRAEIGSYLGLTLETVSRVLSNLNEQGHILVNQRNITLNSVGALRAIAGDSACAN